MLSIRLDREIEERLAELAKKTGRTKTFYAKQLIEANLEELEDRYMAEARLERRLPSLSGEQVKKALGLDR